MNEADMAEAVRLARLYDNIGFKISADPKVFTHNDAVVMARLILRLMAEEAENG